MKKSQKKAIAVGAGIAALAAAAAGTYLLTGKRGTKNRKKIGKWADQIKKEVAQELRKAENVSEKAYAQAVDAVAKRYKKVQHIDAKELASLTAELKSYWNDMARTAQSAKKRVQKAIAPKKAHAKKKASAKKKATTKKKRR